MGKYYKKLSLLFVQVVSTFFLVNILVYFSKLISNNIDLISNSKPIDIDLTKIAIILVLGVFLSFIKSFFALEFGNQVSLSLKEEIGEKIVNLKMSYFTKQKRGETINKISSDIAKIEVFSSETVPKLLEILITIGIILFSIFSLSISVGIVIAFCILIILFASKKSGEKLAELTVKRKRLYDELTSVSEDYISGIETGRTLNLLGAMKKNLDRAIDNILNNEYIRIKISSYSWVLQSLCDFIPAIIAISFIMISYMKSDITEGEITYLIILINRLFSSAKELPVLVNEASESVVSIKRIGAILKEDEEEKSVGNYLESNKSDAIIEFNDIGFGYDDKKKILDGVSFKINAGEKVAIVGNSGGGKSTVFNILVGFYNADFGKYEIFGKDRKNIRLESLREKFSIVSQDTHLFAESIFENIRYGNKEATLDEVMRVCKIANIHEKILSMEKGYDKLVGDGNVSLSGGEKQRISIARAILKDAPILLLDEPTSALDKNTEDIIQEALNSFGDEKTIITIAHRLSTIEKSDKIIVIENGKKIEEGTHEELMTNNGFYYNLNSIGGES